jgi:hypothetical protein
MRSVVLVAALAVGFAGVAGAAEVKKDSKAPASALSSKTMTNSDMDKLTAGAATVLPPGPGLQVTLPAQGGAAAGASATGVLNSGGKAATLSGGL